MRLVKLLSFLLLECKLRYGDYVFVDKSNIETVIRDAEYEDFIYSINSVLGSLGMIVVFRLKGSEIIIEQDVTTGAINPAANIDPKKFEASVHKNYDHFLTSTEKLCKKNMFFIRTVSTENKHNINSTKIVDEVTKQLFGCNLNYGFGTSEDAVCRFIQRETHVLICQDVRKKLLVGKFCSALHNN